MKDTEENKLKNLSQFIKTECSCEECIGYCKKSPGWFRPLEISPLAKFLKLSIKAVIERFLIADYWITDSKDIYVLTPVKNFEESQDPLILEFLRINEIHRESDGIKIDSAGGRASWSYAFWRVPCIFLKDDKCSVYPVRPFECAVSWHGDRFPNIRELIADEWRHEEILERLNEGGPLA